ncbi:atp dependent lon protease family member [Holotrichia oblita]|nr:atp dependent lon protease family member [Holotrichia oblita]
MNIDKDTQLPLLLVNDRFVFPGTEAVIDFSTWPSDYKKMAVDTFSNAHSLLCGNMMILGFYEGDFNQQLLEGNGIKPIGILVKIKSFRFLNNDIIRANLIGVNRVTYTNIRQKYDLLIADYQNYQETAFDGSPKALKIIKKISEILKDYSLNNSTAWTRLPPTILERVSKGGPSYDLIDVMAQYFRMDNEVKMQVIQELDIEKRLKLVVDALAVSEAENQLETEINNEVRRRIDASQREYMLREKMKVIKEQLGEAVDKDRDIDELKKLVNENPYPEKIKEKALDEIRRYEMMPPNSSEAMVIRNYLDWLLKTPWYQTSEEQKDFNQVEEILSKNHYGLEKPKERILEYLAVREFAKSSKAPIICFSGPPGIGKTSLAKSIAEALNKTFVKISLGGVHDEAEIRGHRRTYLGSMPGRIIQAMRKAGVVNPVFLLDEIDKVSSDYKGDPSSALLEVLDPEQNKFFSDHYLEEPYDLSNALFITTANYLENISPPLRDRLEIIPLSSYTELEKLNIAKEHLIPRQAEECGLSSSKIKFSEDAILHIIRYYTREAGVRQLERYIGAICRKTIVKQLKGVYSKNTQQLINIKKVREFLEKERFDYTKKEKVDQIGVVTGLAYTEFGGDILPIEVTYFEGKGKFILTGSLGDVMKESAEIAVDYIKANAKKLGIDPSIFEKIDIHIHAPEGAVPKDGPSAGVTMTAAIVSALTMRAVKSDIAMTGEITLRGNVLPIGGLKEKSISAHRVGIKKIFIPRENEKDLDEIPKQVLSELEIVLADNVETILEAVLVERNDVRSIN